MKAGFRDAYTLYNPLKAIIYSPMTQMAANPVSRCLQFVLKRVSCSKSFFESYFHVFRTEHQYFIHKFLTPFEIQYCEEKDRSWCSSNAANDHRAITIEVASDTQHPYAVNDKAYAALIDLCVDICQRNGIAKLVWSTSKDDRVNHRNGCNMTVHRD